MEDFNYNEALVAILIDFFAGDDGIQDGNDIVPFHYTDGKVIPKNATHVTIDSSVRRLCDWLLDPSISNCYNIRLTTAELPEGLESIGDFAFSRCVSLTQINIPSTVKVIGNRAFGDCLRLESVVLPQGLEQLGELAFIGCSSLLSITIPPMIKAIEKYTFNGCASLRDVYLSEGLESIGDEAFSLCPFLRHISIPPTVKEISPHTFGDDFGTGVNIFFRVRRNLERVQFCDYVEEFVSGESIRYWWKHGVTERSLETYNFLVRCNIPARLLLLGVMRWQATIHEMLRRIPSTFMALDDYFNTIDSTLVAYESLPDALSLLELAIWKSKILEQQKSEKHDMSKSQCRIECGACVIIPAVLSFL